jgi:hypothetical protein
LCGNCPLVGFLSIPLESIGSSAYICLRVKKCSYCGRACADDAQYCDGCGTEFAIDKAPAEPLPKAPRPIAFAPVIAMPPALSTDAELLDVSAIDMGFSIVEGFSRPDWPQLRKQIAERFVEADQPQVWLQIARQWITQLCEDLGGDYACYESDRFLLLSAETDEISQSFLETAEQALAQLWSKLNGVARQWSDGKSVILAFHEKDDYYSYISYFYAEGRHNLSRGVFVKQGYAHLAVFCGDVISEARSTIIHELTHNCLGHLPIPLWLNEGICQRMQRHNLPRRRAIVLDHDLAAEHRAWWNETNIQDFWAGKSFGQPGEPSKLSYSLGEILAIVLSDDWPRFLEFVAQADFRDAGQDAAINILGRPLEDAVVGFLGPGNWRPSRKAIAERMAATQEKARSDSREDPRNRLDTGQ